jgi:UDP-GlcNAc:undecaprenyl-phosphate GlcNAc-1-phosphate transferase
LLVCSGIRTKIVYIGPYWNLLATFLWVLGITNAFNHLDILDGLAGGVALICTFAFYLLALNTANFVIAIVCLALAGIVLGFLRYNLPSAKVYMGNSGSHFLGFVLAAIAITISYAPLERKLALLSPILVLGLPIFDTSFLMLVRMRHQRPIVQKSDDHFVLKFLKRGYSEKRALALMYLLGLFFSTNGLIISRVTNQIGIVIFFTVAAVSILLYKVAS